MNKTLYRFSRHFFLGWSLLRWIIVGLLLSPFLCLFTVLQASPWRWGILVLLLFLVAIVLTRIWQTRQSGYLTFKPEVTTEAITPTPLKFPDKIPLRTSGQFSVSKATRYFVEEVAHYQTFQTRERVVMLEMTQTRFLLLAVSTDKDHGWWYTFFMPDQVQSIILGQAHFGDQTRPALQIVYLPEEAEITETLYLSFETTLERNQVIADLLVDGLEISEA